MEILTVLCPTRPTFNLMSIDPEHDFHEFKVLMIREPFHALDQHID